MRVSALPFFVLLFVPRHLELHPWPRTSSNAELRKRLDTMARAPSADVTERLGMSSGKDYRFYASEQALGDAVTSNQIAVLTDSGRDIAGDSGSVRERTGATTLMTYYCKRNQMINQSSVHGIVDIAMRERWTASEAFKRNCRAVVTEFVVLGRPRGEFALRDLSILAGQALSAFTCIHHPPDWPKGRRSWGSSAGSTPNRRSASSKT